MGKGAGAKGKARAVAVDPRSVARLQAIQALYEILYSGHSVAQVVKEFKSGERRYTETADGAAEQPSDTAEDIAPDLKLFEAIVISATGRSDELDSLVANKMADGRSPENRETLLGLILKCGAAELTMGSATPAAVIVNEYVDATHAFYAGREPALVNGVLDAIAKDIKAQAST